MRRICAAAPRVGSVRRDAEHDTRDACATQGFDRICLFIRCGFSTYGKRIKTYGNVLVGSGCGGGQSSAKKVKKGVKMTNFKRKKSKGISDLMERRVRGIKVRGMNGRGMNGR